MPSLTLSGLFVGVRVRVPQHVRGFPCVSSVSREQLPPGVTRLSATPGLDLFVPANGFAYGKTEERHECLPRQFAELGSACDSVTELNWLVRASLR